MIGLDTNVLVRFITQDVEPLASRATEFMGSLTPEEPGFITMVTVVELNWVLRTTYGMSKDRVLDILEGLLRSPELEFDEGESLWRAVMAARGGADLPDAYIADSAHLFGCTETVTLDKRAAKRAGMTLLS